MPAHFLWTSTFKVLTAIAHSILIVGVHIARCATHFALQWTWIHIDSVNRFVCTLNMFDDSIFLFVWYIFLSKDIASFIYNDLIILKLFIELIFNDANYRYFSQVIDWLEVSCRLKISISCSKTSRSYSVLDPSEICLRYMGRELSSHVA